MTTSSNCQSALLALAILCWAGVAHAEPTPTDIDTARSEFKLGEAARAKNDPQSALEHLRRAHDLAHTPITGVELGAVYADLGRLIEARDVWREVSRMPEQPGDSASTKRARAEVKERLGPLEKRIPSLRIDIKGPAESLSIDGKAVSLDEAKQPIVLDPGKHTIRVDRRAEPVDLIEGNLALVTFDMTVAPATPPSGPVAPMPTPPPPDASMPTLFWAGLGTAGVGLVVGGITGALALSKKGDVANTCPDHRCPPSAQSDIDASKTFGTISTVAFVVAGVGAAVAVVSLIVNRPPPRTSWMTLRGTF